MHGTLALQRGADRGEVHPALRPRILFTEGPGRSKNHTFLGLFEVILDERCKYLIEVFGI